MTSQLHIKKTTTKKLNRLLISGYSTDTGEEKV